MENKILKAIQEGISLEKEPYKILAEKVGIDETRLLEILQDLKNREMIRKLSPIYDTRMLGYDSAVVAFQTDPQDVESAAKFINTHPGVSHNYERSNKFNIWFTMATAPDSELGMEKTIELLAEKTNAKAFAILRAVKIFKIGVKLDMESVPKGKEDVNNKDLNFTPLSKEDKDIICITQDNLPLTSRPFAVYSEKLGMNEDDLLNRLKEFEKKGTMRRFAAILHHRKAGFSTNSMSVWQVPEEKINDVGMKIAAFKAISHCIQRTTNDLWPYNIYGVVHGKLKEDVDSAIRTINEEITYEKHGVLTSTQEFKKQRVKYFTGDLHIWENTAASIDLTSAS